MCAKRSPSSRSPPLWRSRLRAASAESPSRDAAPWRSSTGRSKTPTGRPAGQPVNRVPPVRRWLFPVVHRHLQLLAGPERRSDRGLDLDHTAGLGVASHTGGALPRLEIPEPCDLYLRALFQLAGDDALVVEQGLDRAARVSLGHLGPHGQRIGELGFVHSVSL